MQQSSEDVHAPYDPTDLESVLWYAHRLVGRTLREAIGTPPARKGKGNFGQDLEKFYFGLPNDNECAPDFRELGLELKSGSLRRLKSGGFSVKERVTLTGIQYRNLPEARWEDSAVLSKCRHILFVMHEYIEGAEYLDEPVRAIGIWHMDNHVEGLLRRDWLEIQRVVVEDGASELSGRQTSYLEAATGGSDSEETRPSDETGGRAKTRRFAFKAKFIKDFVLQCLDFTQPILDTAPDSADLLPALAARLGERFAPAFGLDDEALRATYAVPATTRSKNYHDKLTRAVLGVDASTEIAEFARAGVWVRSIRLDWGKNVPRESVSFPYFKYMDIVNETWRDSTLREQWSRPILFVIYRADSASNERYVLSDVRLWKMPNEHLEAEVQRVWRETVARIEDGRADKLPKLAESEVCHVRPHGGNAADAIATPRNGRQTKKCFWLRNTYVAREVVCRQGTLVTDAAGPSQITG